MGSLFSVNNQIEKCESKQDHTEALKTLKKKKAKLRKDSNPNAFTVRLLKSNNV